MQIKIDLKKFKINRVIKYFIIADLVFLSGWGLLGPVFSIFVIEKIEGATLLTVGAVAAFYWIVRGIVELPVALYIDKKEGEKDDFYVLLLGLMLAGFAAISFLLVKTIPGLFLVQFIQAIAFSFYAPAWSAIFSRHLDKKQYAFDWSLDHTAISLAYGFSAFIGGTLANFFGFKAVFIIASILSFAGMFLLFSVPNLILPRVSVKKSIIKDHTPVSINK